MSANISKVNGINEIFTAGKSAWHGLGQNVATAQSWKEAAKLAHMQWTVDKKQLQYAGKDVPAWALFRSDNEKFLGTCGPVYTPIQNEDAFTMVDALLTEGGAHYETAGVIGNGEIIWTMAKIPDEIRIANTNDISKNYLLFVDFRQQGKSAIVKICVERVVCQNTLNVALSEKTNFFRIPHNGNIQFKIDEARKFIGTVKSDIITLSDKLNHLAKVKATREIQKKFLTALFPAITTSPAQQNKAEKVLELFESNDNNAIPEVKGTAYSLLQSVTNYVDHFANVQVRNADGTTNLMQVKEYKRAESAMFGNGDEFKTEALNTILDLVEVGEVKPTSKVESILSQMSI